MRISKRSQVLVPAGGGEAEGVRDEVAARQLSREAAGAVAAAAVSLGAVTLAA
jgi:aspartokinase-like uncharacterized kinase